MPKKIVIEVGKIRAEAELNETATARLIWNALPLTARAKTWGDEIYFEIPVEAQLENPVEVVDVGDLAYWPRGAAFCIFFGPTPVSRGNEIRPASAVNIVGRVRGDAGVFRSVANGDEIRLSQSE